MKETSLYFECNAGISGDMAVASLLDAGASEEVLQNVLKSMPVKGFSVEIKRVKKSGLDCADFLVNLEKDNHDHDMEYLFEHEKNINKDSLHLNDECVHHEHRTLKDILKIIDKTLMTENAKELSKKIFTILAEAESKAHNVPVEEVHFHEVGALDSIVDIISFAVCFDDLKEKYNIQKVYVPYLCEGHGTIKCQHGIIPIPVPAVCNMVERFKIPLKMLDVSGEYVTPTGAAAALSVASDFKMPEKFVIIRTGLGAGKRSYEIPGILRAFIIEEESGCNKDFIYKLETNIDDSTGENLGFVLDMLLKNGAKDVNFSPCVMKKNRPACLLTVLCSECDVKKMEELIFMHTSTIGIRKVKMERSILPRREFSVSTEYGNANVKEVTLSDGSKRFYPEYESVAEIAKNKGLPFLEVYRFIQDEAVKK